MAIYDVSTNEKKASPSLVAGGTLYADSPVGTIIPYGGASAPSGWFLCDGTAVSRTTYSELFAVIGTAFGEGDGSTTFNLPDMRESVPKGAGLTGKTVGAHLDADGLAVGEFLDDRIQQHKHYRFSADNNGSFYAGVSGEGNWTPSSTDGDYGSETGHIMDARHGATTEVKSVGVNYIIKAKMIGVPADFLAKVDEAILESPIVPSNASASNKLVTADGLNSRVNVKTWIPDGENPLTSNYGLFVYSTNPSNKPAQGIPSGLSEYGTLLGFGTGTNYNTMLYMSVLGEMAFWASNQQKWFIISTTA